MVTAIDNGSEGSEVAPDGKEIWVANAQDGTLSVLSLPEKKVLQTLQVKARGANRLTFTPDGNVVLVSSGPSSWYSRQQLRMRCSSHRARRWQ